MRIKIKNPTFFDSKEILFGGEKKIEGVCPICKKTINFNDFEDELSKKEYQISGMCQKCQNEIFNEIFDE